MSTDREWWNNLDKIWQDEFISNLLQSPGYLEKKMTSAEIYSQINKSSTIITAIVNLQRLNISRKVLFDLTPLFHLKKINDFHLEPLEYNDPNAEYFIKMYPKHLRSKARKLRIDGIPMEDFASLEDFVNVEEIQCQSCQIESLNGIEKLKMLKVLHADQGNSYSDLNPLRGLGITDLNMQFTEVTDISPLTEVPTLEHLDISYLKIKDLSPLLQLPNLKTVTLGNERKLTLKELKVFLDKRGESHPGLTSIKKTPNFEIDNRWYLLPFNPSEDFFGPLAEGRVLVDPSAFNKPDVDDPYSLLVIADFHELCGHLSTTLFYPVELDPEALVDKNNDHSWYVSKVKLLKPVNIWPLLRNSFHNIHQGKINFGGLVTIPEKAQLPTVLYGDLIFGGNLLHPGLSLPIKVKGELRFESCNIPSVLRFPYELDTLIFRGCSLEQSYKFTFKTSPKISIEGCILPEKFVFPDIPYKVLSFYNVKIPASLELPDCFTGMLEFEKCSIPSGFKMPSTINGELVIRFPRNSERLKLPSNGDYELAISDESELLNYDVPDTIKNKMIIDDCPF